MDNRTNDLICAVIRQAAYDFITETKLVALYEKKMEEIEAKYPRDAHPSSEDWKQYKIYRNRKTSHKESLKSIEDFFRDSPYVHYILNVSGEEILKALKERLKERHPYKNDYLYFRRREKELLKKYNELIASSEF